MLLSGLFDNSMAVLKVDLNLRKWLQWRLLDRILLMVLLLLTYLLILVLSLHQSWSLRRWRGLLYDQLGLLRRQTLLHRLLAEYHLPVHLLARVLPMMLLGLLASLLFVILLHDADETFHDPR